MSDALMMEKARQVFQILCNALDHNEMQYEADPEKMVVYFSLKGKNMPMEFILAVDARRQMITALSNLPFQMHEDKRLEGAAAVAIASLGMVDGNFDFDIKDGSIAFRLTVCFLESEIGENLIHYMIGCSAAMVDKYNAKFQGLNDGTLSLAALLETE